MIGLIKKSSFFYFTHLCTFSLIGLAPSFEGDFGVVVAMSAMVPLWMTSSVLWAERTEKYRFLRTLPVTDKELVTVKLALVLAAGVAYLGIISTFILIAGERGGRLSVNLSTALCACLLSILLAFIWQACIWRFGIGPMTPVLGIAGALLFLLVMLPLIARGRPRLIGINEVGIFQLLSHPVWFVFLVIVGGLVFCGLWRIAIPIFENSDPE